MTTFKVHFVQLDQMAALLLTEDNELIWREGVTQTTTMMMMMLCVISYAIIRPETTVCYLVFIIFQDRLDKVNKTIRSLQFTNN